MLGWNTTKFLMKICKISLTFKWILEPVTQRKQVFYYFYNMQYQSLMISASKKYD